MFQFHFEQSNQNDVFDQGKKWDLLIVGAGPAGLNAGLYAKRKGMQVGILAGDIGGQLHNTTTVDNYLGFPLIEGSELSESFFNHLNQLDVPILKSVQVKKIRSNQVDFLVEMDDGREFNAKTVLVATGGSSRKLAIPGEAEFASRGVTYCATCDAPLFKDKHVIVAGGGNSAAEGVLDLVPYAKQITVVHRSQWRADQILLDKLAQVDKLTVFLETQLLEVHGGEVMTGVKVLDKNTNETRWIEADGLLIEIGTIPNSRLIQDLVLTNDKNEVIVDKNQMTSLPGLFAAGDVTEQPFKQIIISVAEGAKAALAANQYLNHHYKGE